MLTTDMEYLFARRILALANSITKSRNADIRALGLTSTQADALHFFVREPDRSAVDLKEHLHISHQAARSLIERMTDKGLLQSVPSGTDARYKLVSATDKGLTVHGQMLHNGAHAGSYLLRGMSRQQRAQLLILLELAQQNLEEA